MTMTENFLPLEDVTGIARIALAKAEILEVAQGKRGIKGNLPCPVCGTGTLRYSIAASNGHVMAVCTTAGCVRFME